MSSVSVSLRAWVVFSGLVWLFVGCALFTKGVFLTFLKGPSLMLLCSCFLGMLVGFLKGNYVLFRTAKKVSSRIFSLSSPIRLSKVYSPSYLALLLLMMSLGMLFRFVPIQDHFKGVLDLTIGSALMIASRHYFSFARKGIYLT